MKEQMMLSEGVGRVCSEPLRLPDDAVALEHSTCTGHFSKARSLSFSPSLYQ